MTYSEIVSVQTLVNHLNDPSWIIIDCRHDPFDFQSGYESYLEGHIPNAGFAHMAWDLSGVATSFSGRHPLPDIRNFATKISKWGVDKTTRIIAYDSSGNSYASRLWWICKWIGLVNVSVLDGGWKKWIEDGAPVSTRQITNRRAKDIWSVTPNHSMWVDLERVEQVYKSPNYRIIDARPAARFRGEDERQYPVAGHIPGAINRPYTDNLDSNGCFLSISELRDTFAKLVGDTPLSNVIHQCGAGVTACNNYLAMEMAGLHGTKLYPGSWSEWCSVSGRPYSVGG